MVDDLVFSFHTQGTTPEKISVQYIKNPKERLIKIKVSCRYYEKGSYKHNLRTCTIKIIRKKKPQFRRN